MAADAAILAPHRRRLERAGIALSDAEVARLLDEALATFLPERPPADPARELPPGEIEALRRMGLEPAPTPDRGADPVARTAFEYAALVASSLTVPQAAARLRVDGSRVRQRLAERSLYGIRLPSGWRLPLFQFTEDGLVPGVGRVLPQLDPELHPVEVASWFATPDSDLFFDDEETPVSPLDWLRTGRPPGRVAELAAEQ
jgi:hypothetical protein